MHSFLLRDAMRGAIIINLLAQKHEKVTCRKMSARLSVHPDPFFTMHDNQVSIVFGFCAFLTPPGEC